MIENEPDNTNPRSPRELKSPGVFELWSRSTRSLKRADTLRSELQRGASSRLLAEAESVLDDAIVAETAQLVFLTRSLIEAVVANKVPAHLDIEPDLRRLSDSPEGEDVVRQWREVQVDNLAVLDEVAVVIEREPLLPSTLVEFCVGAMKAMRSLETTLRDRLT